MDTSYIIYGVGAILALISVASFTRKKKEKIIGMNKNLFGFLFLIAGVFFILWQANVLVDLGLPALSGTLTQYVGDQQVLAVAGTSVTSSIGKCTYQPTATYATIDKFGTTTVSGTSYYKPNGEKATTTAITNLNKDTQYTYWVSNSSYYVKPLTKTAGCGGNPFQTDAWSNSSVSLSGYDTVAHASTTDGASNCSMGANDLCNIEVSYQGTAKASGGPFGGVMVIEYNSTLSSVTATGSEILASNPHHLTYTTSATTHTSKQWGYASSMDDGTGNVKKVNIQVKNGASAVGAGSVWYVKFIDANYYVTNDGNIVLDTEKYQNDDTTRAGFNTHTLTMYWGA